MSEIDIQPEDRAVFDRLKSTGRITHNLRRVMTQRWNQCSTCNQKIASGRPAFAGYHANGTSLIVGACCADQLTELATPHYWTTKLNVSVEDAQPVWRYMDFAKFVAMLQDGGLYFPRADKLDDRFEGAAGLATREQEWDLHYLDFFKRAVATPPPGYPQHDISEESLEREASKLLKQLKSVSSSTRSLLVSCWHGNSVESEALWRLYCPPPMTGIAIRSNVGRLWDATAQEGSAVVGRVHYLNFRKSFAHLHSDRIFCKRQSLSHEQEIRAVLENRRTNPVSGKIVACDLNALIDEVIVSPFAPPWFSDIVSGVIQKFGYAFEWRASELMDEPFY